MLNKYTFRSIALAVVLATAPFAYAQKAGDIIGFVGGAYIAPNASLGATNSVGPASIPFNAALAGSSASIGGVSTVTLSALYMVTDHIAGEFTIGLPPKLTLDVQLASGAHPGAATANALTPSLIGKYLFNDPKDALRPYLGIGVSYVSFSNVSANTSDPLIANLAGSSASLSSSWAPVFNAGMLYNINDRWSINGSISYVPAKTDFTFVGAGAGTGTTTTGTLALNPMEYVLRVGYKF